PGVRCVRLSVHVALVPAAVDRSSRCGSGDQCADETEPRAVHHHDRAGAPVDARLGLHRPHRTPLSDFADFADFAALVDGQPVGWGRARTGVSHLRAFLEITGRPMKCGGVSATPTLTTSSDGVGYDVYNDGSPEQK